MEIEAKFHIKDLPRLRHLVQDTGARLIAPRTIERNLRFDDANGELVASHTVLRLREDNKVTCTFKRPLDRIERRVEYEVEVDDFDQMQAILESLGFTCIFIYEKFRETFQLDVTEIMIDELPFGYFIEVEGPDIATITEVSHRLDLNWESRVALTYIDVFENLKSNLDLPFRDATFENFKTLPDIVSDDLGYPFADLNKTSHPETS